MEKNETLTTPAPEEKKKRTKHADLLHPTSGKGLAVRIVLFLLVPYLYLLLCGLVFDRWLHMYNMTTFIFFSYAALQIAGIVLTVIVIINYSNRNKKSKAIKI